MTLFPKSHPILSSSGLGLQHLNREGGAIPHAHTGGQNQGAPKVCQEWGVVWPCSQELRLISARARTRQPLGRRRLRPRRLHLLPEGSGAAASRGGAPVGAPSPGLAPEPILFPLSPPQTAEKPQVPHHRPPILVHPHGAGHLPPFHQVRGAPATHVGIPPWVAGGPFSCCLRFRASLCRTRVIALNGLKS